ncbi:hypothetical protein FRC11_014431, partial [Ceratobasidium sp. 423]
MPSNSVKRKCIESSCKHEDHENEEALKHNCEDKKNDTKARKARHEEAKEDDLLVEHEGKAADVTKLRVLTLKLESDNERMHAQLKLCEKQDQHKPTKMIPEPENLAIIDVELLHMHMDILDKEHDIDSPGDDKDNDHDHKVAAQKAALHKSVECKAGKLQAKAELKAQCTHDDTVHNDGETEIEELPDVVRNAVEHGEIG